jgi:hypothetical protein
MGKYTVEFSFTGEVVVDAESYDQAENVVRGMNEDELLEKSELEIANVEDWCIICSQPSGYCECEDD